MKNKFIVAILLFNIFVYANEKSFELIITDAYVLKCYQTAEKGFFGWKDTFDKKTIKVVQDVQKKNNSKEIAIVIGNQKYVLSQPADNIINADYVSSNARVYNIETTNGVIDQLWYIKKFTIKTEKFIRQYECLLVNEINHSETITPN